MSSRAEEKRRKAADRDFIEHPRLAMI